MPWHAIDQNGDVVEFARDGPDHRFGLELEPGSGLAYDISPADAVDSEAITYVGTGQVRGGKLAFLGALVSASEEDHDGDLDLYRDLFETRVALLVRQGRTNTHTLALHEGYPRAEFYPERVAPHASRVRVLFNVVTRRLTDEATGLPASVV